MSTFGNLALRQGNDTKHKMMVEYLSAEDGYWYKNDKWRADTAAYKKTGLRDVRFPDEAIVDFSGYQNEWLKLEVKYFILYGMKHKWRSPYNLQNMQKSAVRMLGERIGCDLSLASFSQIDVDDESDMPDITAGKTPLREYKNLRRGVIEFISDIYDEREETEKDVWHALRIPGVKLSAATKRQNPSMNFTELTEFYRPMVKRFMKRLVTRRSWSYCKEMLMYIRYFFRVFHDHGYGEGFLENLARQDVESYLCWVAEDYERCNATFRSKAVSFVRIWLDYIQIAEYPLAPEQSIERLIFEDDVPKRERAADTIEKVRYIPAPIIQQMDACIEQIEPAEMRPVYILLRETGWRGTDVLNLRYDTCLQYDWDAREGRSVPYLYSEITKVGIPQLKDPIRDEVAEMVKLLAEEAAVKSTKENNPDRYLFNCYEGRCMGLPFSKPAFSSAVQKMIDKNDIRDAGGTIFHFKAHGLRHYVECF